MDGFIIAMLNAISSGASSDVLHQLALSPREYSSAMYEMSVTLANVALKPVAVLVLAVVAMMSAHKMSEQSDGNASVFNKKLIFLILQIGVIFTFIMYSDVVLTGIFELARVIIEQATHIIPFAASDGSASQLGDELADAIRASGPLGQIPLLILCLIPFMLSQASGVVVQVIFFLRFAQIYVLLAFNPIPMSLLLLDDTRPWSMGYYRNMVIAAIQPVVVYVGIALYRVYLQSVLHVEHFTGDDIAGWMMANLSGLSLASILLIVVVIQSSSMTGKIFGE